jgi:hypothetical protein
MIAATHSATVRSVATLVLLAQSSLAQAPPPGDVRRLGEPIPLPSSSSLTVTRDEIQAWRSGYPEFNDTRGILTAFRFTFKGTFGFTFGMDDQDASKSDIVLRCGQHVLNFTKMAALNPKGGKAQVADKQNAGGMRFQGADGRRYGMIFVDEVGFGNHQLVFFFDLPTDCGGERLFLSITQEVEKVRRVLVFNAGSAGI